MDLLRTKPVHVPDWLWTDYAAELADWKSPNSETDEDEVSEENSGIETFSRLVAAKGMTKGWMALKKRESVYARLRTERLTKRSAGKDISYLLPYNSEWASMFAWQCSRALTGLKGLRLMTRMERNTIARNVIASASDLMVALTAIGWHGFDSEDGATEIDAALQTYGQDSVKRFLRHEQNKRQYKTKEAQEALKWGAYLISHDIEGLMKALQKGVTALALRETLISKPNDKNAARLYFLRALTNFCNESYETPLRGVVFSACEVFFDCSDIDANDLTNLAPIKANRPKN